MSSTPIKAANKSDLSPMLLFGWGLGTLPVALFFNTFNALALRYITDVVGLSAALAGSLIALSKLYDAVSDPAMGWISDRTKSRFGKRRIYLLLGGIACGAAIAFLFSIAAIFPGAASPAVIFGALILYATAYTIYNVPYLAMPSEITESGTSRSQLMTWRVFFIGTGALIAGFVGPRVVEYAGGGADGHQAMGLVIGGLIVVAAVVVFGLTSGAPSVASRKAAQQLSWREKIATVASNRPFVILLSLKLFQLMAVAVAASTLAFFTVWILGKDYGALGTILLLSTLGQIIGTPVWLWIYRRIGAKRSFNYSAAIFGLSSLTWLFASPEEAMWVTLLRVFLKGLGTGGILLVGQALLPDAIEYDRLQTGLRREGVLSGFYTTIEKMAFAIGTALVGLWLSGMGYVPQLNPFADTQSESALMAVQFCQSIFPTVLIGVAALLILLYPLNEEKLEQMRQAASEG